MRLPGGYEIIRAAEDTGAPVARPALRRELGQTGSKTRVIVERETRAVADEEYNADLRGAELYRVVDKMRRSDTQIKAAGAIVKLPLLAADWHHEPASDDPRDIEIAEALDRWIIDGDDMSTDFDDFLRHAFLALDYGFMAFEPVWDVFTDPVMGRPVVHPRKFAPRMPSSISEITLDDHGGLTGIIQASQNAGEAGIFIPVRDAAANPSLLLFTNEKEGSNFRGVSIWRQAYRDWYEKDKFRRLNGIIIEKRGAGIDVATIKGTAGSDKQTLARRLLQSLRTHQSEYVIETDDFTYRTEGAGAAGVLDPLPSIKYCDLMILRGVLAEMQDIGSGALGGATAAGDKSTFLLMGLRAYGKMITGTYNRHFLPRLVDLNWPGVKQYPKLVHSRLDRRDAKLVADALAMLIPQGVIAPDDGIEDEIRELLDLPERLDGEADGDAPTASRAARSARGRRTRVGTSRRAPQVRAGSTRVMTAEEKAVDWLTLERGLNSAERNIVKGYKSVQARQIAKIVEEAMKAINAGDPERLEKIGVPFREEATDAVLEPLLALYRLGSREVQREVSAVHAGTIALAGPLDPSDDAAIIAFLRTRARGIVLSLSERIRGSLLANALNMIRTGNRDRGFLEGALTALSDRDIRREAGYSVSEALNLGRQSTAAENEKLIRSVQYSAILDGGTCEPCRAQDGATVKMGSPEYDRLRPPYRECRGRGRCRCVFVFTFESETP